MGQERGMEYEPFDIRRRFADDFFAAFAAHQFILCVLAGPGSTEFIRDDRKRILIVYFWGIDAKQSFP